MSIIKEHENSTKLTFSIVIPTRNEEKDIAATLEFALSQTLPPMEVIVVDDSDDGTPDIISQYYDKGVKLLRGQRKGRCGARNQGILAAGGEIVVILNADAHLPSDFLSRIAEHYRSGAAYVVVDDAVENQEALLARYLGTQAIISHQKDHEKQWSEGFSCRRTLAIQAGLFLETYPPLVAGEDGPFGRALNRLGRKVFDRSILVTHIAPADLPTFWSQQKERGYPHTHYFVYKRTMLNIFSRSIAKQALRLLRIGLLVPMVITCFRYSRSSRRRRGDVCRFLVPYIIEMTALTVGEWEGLIKLKKSF